MRLVGLAVEQLGLIAESGTRCRASEPRPTPEPGPMAMLASTVELALMVALLSMAEPEQMEAFVAMPWAAVLAAMSSMVPLEQPASMGHDGVDGEDVVDGR